LFIGSGYTMVISTGIIHTCLNKSFILAFLRGAATFLLHCFAFLNIIRHGKQLSMIMEEIKSQKVQKLLGLNP